MTATIDSYFPLTIVDHKETTADFVAPYDYEDVFSAKDTYFVKNQWTAIQRFRNPRPESSYFVYEKSRIASQTFLVMTGESKPHQCFGLGSTSMDRDNIRVLTFPTDVHEDKSTWSCLRSERMVSTFPAITHEVTMETEEEGLREAFPIARQHKILFSQEVSITTTKLKRWQPTISINASLFDDDE